MVPVYDFSWGGESAFYDHGIDTLEIGSTVIAERRDKTHVVAGRSGLVHDQDGAVEEVEQRIKIHLPYSQGRTVSPMAQIRSWLKGYKQLTLSTIPNRYMMAYITDMISLDPVIEGFADVKGPLIFRCDPWLYHADSPEITITEAAVLSNPGTAPAAPVITVRGSGNMDLMIGGQTILLHDVPGVIVLDGVLEECYARDEYGLLQNLSRHVTGDAPVLPVGDVPVSWSLEDGASLQDITICPNWRDEW